MLSMLCSIISSCLGDSIQLILLGGTNSPEHSPILAVFWIHNFHLNFKNFCQHICGYDLHLLDNYYKPWLCNDELSWQA